MTHRFLSQSRASTRSARWCRTTAALRLERLEDRNLLSFLAPLAFDAGTGPESVAVADLNRDGRLDLAVANRDSNNVSVLLGNGDGTFQAARNFSAGLAPVSVAVGDFNRDALPDLAVAGFYCDEKQLCYDETARVLLGNGDGTFQAARHFPAEARPSSVAVGEFNGDGRLDLVVANFGSGTVSVLLGNGDGTSQAAQHFPAGFGPRFVAVGDVNGDGRFDFAVANYHGHNVSVLLGNGNGTFQAARDFPTGLFPTSVAVGDVNSDDCPDLVVTSTNVSVLLGNGDGTFQTQRILPAGSAPRSVAVGYVNDDSHRDLVVANYLSNNVSVLLGNGDSTFQAARNFVVGSQPSSVAVAELNGDGRLDLAVAISGRANVSVHLGNGDGSFQAVRHFPAGTFPVSVAVGEFNGDGIPDLAAANNMFSGTVSVLLGNGDGTFQAARHFLVGSFPVSVAVGEFNGDGRLDLAVANAGTAPLFQNGSLSVLLGNGDGTFQDARHFNAGYGPHSVAVADVNADGRPDLAVAGYGFECLDPPECYVIQEVDLTTRVLLGNGDGTFQARLTFPAGIYPNSVAVGEFNGDGRLDLAVTNYTFNGTVSVLLGQGDGSFGAARNFPAGSRPYSMAVADVNGDSLLDLAVANEFSNNVSVLLGNADGTFQAARNFAAGSGPRSVAVGDVNGDDRPDLLVISSATVRVLLGNGDGTFQTTHISYVAGAVPNSVAVGNFNGDGWPDLAVANVSTNDVSILLNAADDAAFFYLDAPAQVPAGQPFDLTVYALSADWQRLAHGYRGTVAFWSSDKAATLPEPYTFRPEDWGIASFPGGVTLRTPGTQYVVAFDLETFTVIGYAVVEVLGAAPGRGRGGADLAADLAFAQAGLDLLTWTRPRKADPIFGGTTMS